MRTIAANGGGIPSITSSRWPCHITVILQLIFLTYAFSSAENQQQQQQQHRFNSVPYTSSFSAFASTPITTTSSRSKQCYKHLTRLVPYSVSPLSGTDSKSTNEIIRTNNNEDEDDGRSLIDKLADAAAAYIESSPLFQPKTDSNNTSPKNSIPELQSSFTGGIMDGAPISPTILAIQTKTLVRTLVPSIVLAILGYIVYTPFASFLATLDTYDAQVLEVIGQDYSQYIQNILTTSGLFFSFLVGNTYYFMYTQQEQVFFALFEEVTEAKSLLEQVALVCSGRSMYPQLLEHISDYVQNDLKILTEPNPTSTTAILSKSRRVISGVEESTPKSNNDRGVKKKNNDPLEKVLYLTSVGVPGVVYDTVRSLRTARANRLGALQRKLPEVHMILLKVLAVVVLATFPVCGSGSQAIAPGILEVQAWLFAVLVFGIALVLNVVTELWQPTRAGAYSVDGVLNIMVRGLDDELQARMAGELNCSTCSSAEFPLPPVLSEEDMQLPVSSASIASTVVAPENDDNAISANEDDTKKRSKRKRLKKWVRTRVFRR